MRIIAGRFKGRRLKAPTWEGLRPTSDRLRETLFNIVSSRLEGASVIDAYAGTGAVGLEALSRGARRVLFIEQDRRAAGLIAANARLCGVEEGYTIEHGAVARVLGRLDAGRGFDLIFLDPPYGDASSGALRAAGRRLHADGLLVLERPTRREPDVPPELARCRDVRSGDSTLTFFTRRTSPEIPHDD